MYGGVAKSFVDFEFLTEPYLKDKKNIYYIKVRNPKTKIEREVRWYTDKAHADLMTQQLPEKPFYPVFGFKSEDDTILAIAEKDLTEEEIQDYFAFKWRFGMFYGGIWYAPEGTELPPIKNSHRFGHLAWPQLKAAGQKHSLKLGLVPKEQSPWFR